MVNYKELGLVNTRDMFARAIKGGYAIPAFNFNNLEQLQAIIKASSELKSPVILQVSKGARNYANETLLRYMAEGAVEYAKELGCKHPEIVLHLDHGDSFELCKSCVDLGFSSVMIDGSALPYEENIALTKKVVEYAHQFDVTVEGELGVLAGVEDEVSSDVCHYTKPEEVIDFTSRTGVDSLAISIGTSHGAYKFTPEQCTRDPKTGKLVPPPLAFDVLDEIFGGYLYFHKAPNARAFHEETVRKLSKLHLYDCLRANKSLSAWGVEGRVPFLDKEFLDVAMRTNPEAKLCPGNTIEKKIVREAFADMLPEEVAWRQKEQFSDGVGYSWIDTLKQITASQVSDEQMAHAAERFPINPPRCKEEYYYRSIFASHFPSDSAARSVPSVPSVACSTAEALAWDKAFSGMNDPSGRAVAGVHEKAY